MGLLGGALLRRAISFRWNPDAQRKQWIQLEIKIGGKLSNTHAKKNKNSTDWPQKTNAQDGVS